MKARTWLALVLAPTAALALPGAMYAFVTPACSDQARLHLHLAAAVALAVVVVLGIVAFGEAALHRAEPQLPDDGPARSPARRRLLANMAGALCALAALAIVAMWLTFWLLSPCRP